MRLVDRAGQPAVSIAPVDPEVAVERVDEVLVGLVEHGLGVEEEGHFLLVPLDRRLVEPFAQCDPALSPGLEPQRQAFQRQLDFCLRMHELVFDLDIGLAGIRRDAAVEVQVVRTVIPPVLALDQDHDPQRTGLFHLEFDRRGDGSQLLAVVREHQAAQRRLSPQPDALQLDLPHWPEACIRHQEPQRAGVHGHACRRLLHRDHPGSWDLDWFIHHIEL